jgi:hypothetical protein
MPIFRIKVATCLRPTGAAVQEMVFGHETLHLDSDLRAQWGNDPDHNDLFDDAARQLLE